MNGKYRGYRNFFQCLIESSSTVCACCAIAVLFERVSGLGVMNLTHAVWVLVSRLVERCSMVPYSGGTCSTKLPGGVLYSYYGGTVLY